MSEYTTLSSPSPSVYVLLGVDGSKQQLAFHHPRYLKDQKQ